MDIHRIHNNQGKRYYGIHFYPGVAQYQDEPSEDPYRVFLNEDTLRRMDKSFEGRPIFVDHVEAVDDNLDRLRGEADGWVVRSFYNETDGKHWVEFLITSELGEKAINQGMRLSNAYVPKAFKTGGLWNGVPYEREIVDAEYEHLAIVENPRYEESVIMTPEQFKTYNEKHAIELKRIANSKDKGAKMKLNFFKRSKVETALDPDTMVTLPNSKKEVSILKLVNDADDAEKKKDKKENADEADKATEGEMARPDHLVTTHKGEVMNVADLVKAHADVCNELDSMKKGDDDGEKKENAEDDEKKKENWDDEDKKKNDDDSDSDSMDNAEDEEKKKKENGDAAEKELEAAKKKNASDKARRIKNAESEYIRSYQNAEAENTTIELPSDRVARGKSRYGAK